MVGIPLFLDSATANRIRLDQAKVFIEVDLKEPIPDVVEVEFENGRVFEIRVEFPWFPSSCSFCKQFGHSPSLCPFFAKSHLHHPSGSTSFPPRSPPNAPPSSQAAAASSPLAPQVASNPPVPTAATVLPSNSSVSNGRIPAPSANLPSSLVHSLETVAPPPLQPNSVPFMPPEISLIPSSRGILPSPNVLSPVCTIQPPPTSVCPLSLPSSLDPPPTLPSVTIPVSSSSTVSISLVSSDPPLSFPSPNPLCGSPTSVPTSPSSPLPDPQAFASPLCPPDPPPQPVIANDDDFCPVVTRRMKKSKGRPRRLPKP